MSKKKEFENQSVEELKAGYNELSKKLFEMRNEISTTHKIEKAHLLRKARRDRARILTVLNKK
jgi:ribosomal protein L29